MGLCKCPKRKTTSHFCFHHCVNVCEHCIVNNHTTCVVKSYTTWLKEASGSVSSSASSASALCAVCQKQFVLTAKDIENVSSNLNDTSVNTKAALRLLCYHVVHARCLSIYVKRQFKEGNIPKCPSCARLLWSQQQEEPQDSANKLDVDSNELSPVALQLYKHLLNQGKWWGQVLLSNGNVTDIEKHLLEEKDDYAEIADEEPQQLFEERSTLETEPIANNVSNSISPLTIDQTVQSSNSNNHYYNFNNSESVHTTPNVTTINHRSNTNQATSPIHQRHFNNNYGIDSGFVQQQQQEHQQQCLSVNMTTISQGSDLSNRHMITSSTPLLSNNDSNANIDELQDPSGKYRPKKFNNQLWFLNFRRPLQYIYGTNNRVEDHGTTRIATIIIFILCLLVIIILLVAITSYTRSNNEPFDNNSIDYGGGDSQDNNGGGVAHLKNYNINNL